MPEPIRIVIVNHTGVVSGGEKVLLLILDNLDRSQFEATVSCPPGTDLAAMVRERNVAVTELPVLVARFTWNPIKLLGYLRSYRDSITELRNSSSLENADIVHANSLRAGLLTSFAMRGKNTPVIWHVHDILKPHPISTAIRLAAFFMPPFSVIAVSKATARRYKGWLLTIAGIRSHVTVVQNPVDTVRFQPAPADRVRVRQELQLSDGQFVFATIGQLTPRKGHLETIRAFRELARTNPDAVLLVVGAAVFDHDREYAEQLRQEVKISKLETKVLFLGQRNDMNGVLAAIDAVVINSKHEPFSLLALESLAARKPVIAAAVDGLPELITDGETGLLVPPGDKTALLAAMQRLVSDPQFCAELSAVGRPYVEKKFTCEAFIKTIEHLYLKAAGRV